MDRQDGQDEEGKAEETVPQNSEGVARGAVVERGGRRGRGGNGERRKEKAGHKDGRWSDVAVASKVMRTWGDPACVCDAE